MAGPASAATAIAATITSGRGAAGERGAAAPSGESGRASRSASGGTAAVAAGGGIVAADEVDDVVRHRFQDLHGKASLVRGRRRPPRPAREPAGGGRAQPHRDVGPGAADHDRDRVTVEPIPRGQSSTSRSRSPRRPAPSRARRAHQPAGWDRQSSPVRAQRRRASWSRRRSPRRWFSRSLRPRRSATAAARRGCRPIAATPPGTSRR